MNREIMFDDDILLCPMCRCTNLHQEEVTTIFRDSEDRDGSKVVCSDNNISIKRSLDKDIPGRRDYMSIKFSCENCQDHIFILSIMQHKGSTLVNWDILGKA